MHDRVRTLSDDTLARLIEGREGARVEFKETLGSNAPRRLREAICAFANNLPGSGQPGIAVVGLRDDGVPAGIDVSDALLRTLADMRSDGNIVPPPPILAEKRPYRDHQIAVVTVLPSDSPPVRYRGAIHVRSGPRRGIASLQDERILNERRRYGDHPIPSIWHPCREPASPISIDASSRTNTCRTQSTANCSGPTIAVVRRRPAHHHLGLLVLGVRPRDFIPGAHVQFLRIGGRDLSDPILDERAIDGAVSETLSRVDDKLQAHNRHQVDILTQSIERRTDKYPLAALRELVRNAIIHRDYETTNAPVRVTWFNDRIEIQNPGGPFGSVTSGNFGCPGITDYRNPNLAEAMRVLGFVQRFGVGIPTARRLLRETGHPKLEVEVSPAHLLTTVQARAGATEAA